MPELCCVYFQILLDGDLDKAVSARSRRRSVLKWGSAT